MATAAELLDMTPAESQPVTVIERRSGWQLVDLGELWRYRELLFFLAWRDIKVRYKQTVLGAAWAVLQPLATMLVFTLMLGRVAGVPDAVVPYPLFVFAGLLPWLFFAGAMTAAGQSVVGNQNLVTKIYFPRLIIPISATGASAVDFMIAFVMLGTLMLGYGFTPSGDILVALPIVLGLMLTAIGMGILLSALTVAYRDFRYVVPFLVQLWMFATPGIYLQSELGFQGSQRLLLALNPAQGFIVNFRAAVLGTPFDLPGLMISSCVAVALALVGSLYFRSVEHSFADII